MSLETPVIIHTYKYGFGGIGDLFRSLMSFYAGCREAGVSFHITLDETPDFKECFDIAPISDTIKTAPSEYNQFIADHRGNVFIQQAIRAAFEEKTVQIVASNVSLLGSPSIIAAHLPSFSSEIIRPSAQTLTKLEEVYLRYGITRGRYASFHVRCGDVYMCRESGIGRSPDIRTTLSPENIRMYAGLLCRFSEKLPENLPIVIHSDSNQFKLLLREAMHDTSGSYIFMDIPIQHVANRLGDNTLTSYIATVAEFYMLVNSAAICMPIYSGFSHIAAVLGDIPLYGPIYANREHQELLASLGPTKKHSI